MRVSSRSEPGIASAERALSTKNWGTDASTIDQAALAAATAAATPGAMHVQDFPSRVMWGGEAAVA